MFYWFVCPLPTCEYNILKTVELILRQIGTSGQWGEEMKR